MNDASRERVGAAYPKAALAILFLLYLSQGLPYGFQKMALPLLLREQGASLVAIGFLGLLALPWMLKALWAPLVDRYYSPKLGRRKSWIVPMQFLLIGAIVFAAAAGTAHFTALLIAVFLMNLFAATQDIAVDGFAIDNLKPHALGLGNTAQVVGYKIGMIAAGGVLLSLSQSLGWQFLFISMALLAALPLVPLLFYKEPPVPSEAAAHPEAEAAPRPSIREIVRTSLRLLTGRELRWAIILILTYKVGEEMIQSMFNAFLFDRGVTREQIGAWIGSYGMAASVTGSILGGVLIVRLGIWKVIGLAAALRIIPMCMQWRMTQGDVTADGVILVSTLEHLAGGALTTAMFAFMMSLVEKRVGATEYTLLASLEVLGKSPAAWSSGLIAHSFGYGTLFLMGTLLAVLMMIPWWKCRALATN
jgi:MFS family permease